MKNTFTRYAKHLLAVLILFVVSNQLNAQCTANFTYTLGPNGTVTFSNTSSVGTGTPTLFWNFGNGQTSNATNPSTTYTANGNYSVNLFIFAFPTCSTSITQTIAITNVTTTACSPNFTYTIGANGNVTFTNTSTGTTSTTTFFWQFGNGQVGTTPNASTTYTANGTYSVTLTMLSIPNCSASITQTLSITNVSTTPCSANFTYTVGTNGNVTFSNTSVGTTSTTTYFWQFGNGQAGSTPNANTTYTANGTYTVTLFIISIPTCSASVSQTISINNVVTGISNYEKESDLIHVYPNPASNELTLKGAEGVMMTQLKIYDLTGRMVLTTESEPNAEIKLSSLGLNNGVYLYKINTSDQKTITGRLVVEK